MACNFVYLLIVFITCTHAHKHTHTHTHSLTHSLFIYNVVVVGCGDSFGVMVNVCYEFPACCVKGLQGCSKTTSLILFTMFVCATMLTVVGCNCDIGYPGSF